jgi:dGTPase
VLRSAALRTLGGKTQCLDLAESPAVRVRLTHVLEVADIAPLIGTPLGADPLLLETAGLAHDLGHPPFGHNGERALNDWRSPAGDSRPTRRPCASSPAWSPGHTPQAA